MHHRLRFIVLFIVVIASQLATAQRDLLPNILWLSVEDIGPHLGCYGDKAADTPNLDAFAKRSLTYDIAWSNYPVCAPARTTIITGVYPAATGSGHMRSEMPLPAEMKFFPQILREAGFYCTNNSKTDYNLVPQGKVDGEIWDESSKKAHYQNRVEGQPFFAVFNDTRTHESRIRKKPHDLVTDPATVELPAYHPDRPEIRRDWGQYYDNIHSMDGWVAKKLKELEESGEADNTIVVFFGDHGSGMPRHKRYPGNSGLHVPMIIHVPPALKSLAPENYGPGARTSNRMTFVDLAPSMLSLAGIEPPAYMQGKALMGKYRVEKSPYYAYGFRGRMDERPDLVRSLRDDRYVYMRNYMPHRPHGQHVSYQFQTITTSLWNRLWKEGELNEVQSSFWTPRPAEELYDLEVDPDGTRNLVGDSLHKGVLRRFREELIRHTLEIGDVGLLPEPQLFAMKKNGSPYDLMKGSSKLERLQMLELADAATMATEPLTDKVLSRIDDLRPTFRYYATLGILVRGKSAVEKHADKLEKALTDNEVSVRITAAEALGRYGDDEQKATAIAQLLADANLENTSPAASVWALNSLGAIGADGLKDEIRSLPAKDGLKRGGGYVTRLIRDMTE